MSTLSNVMDPVSTDLDDRVFNGITPKPTIVQFIQKLFDKAFQSEFDQPASQFAHLYLTGSLTTYQFSDSSDMDISVFLNWTAFKQILNLDEQQARRRCIGMIIDKLDGTFLPGGSHPLQFFMVPPGIDPTIQFQPGLRSGWDFETHKWLVPPEKKRVHDVAKEFPEIYARAAAIGDKMTQMIDAKNYDAALDLWIQVHEKRQLDQKNGGGDFSEGNLVMKFLLHSGILDRLRHDLNLSEYQLDAYKKSVWEDSPSPIINRERMMERFDNLGEDDHMDSNPYIYDPETGEVFPGAKQETHPMIAWRAERDGTRPTHWMGNDAIRGRIFPDGENIAYYDRHLDLTPEEDAKIRAAVQEYEEKNLHSSSVVRVDSPLDQGHTDTRVPWVYDTVTDKLYVGSSGSNHTHVMYEGGFDNENYEQSWEGSYGTNTNKIYIFSQYDNPPYGGVYFRVGDQEIPPALIQNLKEAFPGASINAKDEDDEWIKVAVLDTITMKVLYNFESDHIILGTQADLQNNPGSIILGEYNGNDSVTLYHTDKQWLNANYFKRLWAFSFPGKPLDHVYFQGGQQEDQKLYLPTRPVRHKHMASESTFTKLLDTFKTHFIEHVSGRYGIEEMQDPEKARGMCNYVSKEFVKAAQAEGLEAALSHKGSTADEFGYIDRRIPGYKAHWWAVVQEDGRTFGVDFTAAQYGYEDFPKIKEWNGDSWID